ncbi:MAG: hypothetical protein F4169_11905 [Gammaproteobacteria bacterium]|nr:hypothetical protein [Gammaproteobacteria bacterium]
MPPNDNKNRYPVDVVADIVEARLQKTVFSCLGWVMGILVSIAGVALGAGPSFVESRVDGRIVDDFAQRIAALEDSLAKMATEASSKAVLREPDPPVRLPLTLSQPDTVDVGKDSVRVFVIEVSDAALYQIRAVGLGVTDEQGELVPDSTFDPMIYLYDDEERLIAFDDDGGEQALDSYLQVLLAGGVTYELHVREVFSDPGRVEVSLALGDVL